ncbi:hypothetical protein [Flammeovirga aprica]|uniref:Uncharacterized protein n=1 Tax=Flammeovirga aprica JL-4 TaxID=694437 RepID=A0A7X9P2B8_9BACT|nr:hypothetical protein [Flammeovirga aprica]NME67717.1 hypothetical protein [Flammeovirga aprica JL-4]
MKIDLIKNYETCKFGVAVYKRLSRDNFEFVYYNPWGRKIDGLDNDEVVIGRKLQDVFPNIFEFGLVEILEKVYQTGKTEIFPNKEYVVNEFKSLYRTNRVQKINNDLVVALYTDQKDIFQYLMKVEEENLVLSKALDYISHKLRGDLTTSLGVLELFDTVNVPTNEKETLLKVVKKNLENIDAKIHCLVRILSEHK